MTDIGLIYKYQERDNQEKVKGRESWNGDQMEMRAMKNTQKANTENGYNVID